MSAARLALCCVCSLLCIIAAALPPAASGLASCGVCPGGNESGAVGDFPAALLAVPLSPIGNTPQTLSALALQGETGADDEREFLVSFGLLSSRGNHSRPTPYHDKVTLYASIVGAPGTGDIWAFNPLVTQSEGSGAYDAQGIELDFNNENAHRGEEDAGSGLAPPVSYGLSISGAAPFRSTSAILVSGPGSNAIWNRGITFANDCIAQSSFQDLGSPAKSIDIRGAAGYGIYQSNTATKNFFAGGTGVGAEPDAAAALTVGGDLVCSGRLRVAASHGGARIDRSPLLLATAPGATDAVVSSGVAELNSDGVARITLPAGAAPQGSALAYQLTAIGAPMPLLHVREEAAAAAAAGAGAESGASAASHAQSASVITGDLAFVVAGGAPHKRVSWQVTALFAAAA